MTGSVFYRGFIVAMMLLPACKVMAREVSFEYVQASYISDTVDFGGSLDDIEGNGIGFALSLGFSSAFTMTLAVDATTFDTFQGMDVDTTKTTSLGITGHASLLSGTDIFANVAAVKAEITADNGIDSTSDSDIGGAIKIGIRHLIADTFEVELGVSHTAVLDYELNSQIVETRLYVWRELSVGFGYIASDDLESLTVNARMDI